MGVGIKFNIPSATPKNTFRLFLLIFWSQFTLFKFITEAIERIPVIGGISDYISPTLFISLIILSAPYIASHLRLADFLFYLSVVLVILCTLLWQPDSSEFIHPYLWRILMQSVPLYFIGVAYDHDEMKKDLYWCSLLSVITMFMYQLYVLSTGRVLESDNMSASYNILPSVMYLIYWAVDNNSTKNWVIAIAASVLPFVFGTRGAILAVLVFLAICVIYRVLRLENIAVKIIVILLCVGGVAYIATGDRILNWAMFMSDFFGEIGFSTRIFDFIIEDELATSEGRENLNELVWTAITDNPVYGYGFMGDRTVIGFYTHNYVLEMLCSFGLVMGSIFVLISMGLPIVAFLKNRKDTGSWVLIMMACLVFIKLMLSGSYVYEANFYLLLGMSVGALRTKKQHS